MPGLAQLGARAGPAPAPAVRMAIVTAVGSSMSATYSGSVKPRMTLVRSKTNCSWLRGMPIMSRMIRSGSRAATSVTKSASPRSAISSTISAATPSTSAFIEPELPGREPPGHDAAHAGVAGVVHVDHRPEELDELGRQVGDVGALARAEQLGVPAGLDDVGVPGDGVVGRLGHAHVGQPGQDHPGDRPLGPQGGEGLGPLVEAAASTNRGRTGRSGPAQVPTCAVTVVRGRPR